MKKDFCEIVIILDESGSMSRVTEDTIGGFNTFIETHQKLPGEAKLTLVKFNSNGKDKVIFNGIDVRNLEPLTKKTYTPGGNTALLDAVGKTIDTIGQRLSETKEDERPEKVIFLIITDGEENDSSKYNLEKIKSMITTQKEKYSWEFVFLGADQDAWSNAHSMGMNQSVNYSINDTNRIIKGAAYYTANVRSKSAKLSMDNFSLSDAQLDQELNDLTKTDNTLKTP